MLINFLYKIFPTIFVYTIVFNLVYGTYKAELRFNGVISVVKVLIKYQNWYRLQEVSGWKQMELDGKHV